MSTLPSTKSQLILDAAAELFATKPFHEVRLEDIAAKAHVGKGTVYLYWSSKEEVYMAVIRRGFAAVIETLDRELPRCMGKCWDEIGAVIGAIIGFAYDHPGVYHIMRSGMMTPEDPEIQRIRKVVTDRIEQVLQAGITSGQIVDPVPALTTQYMLSFVRGAVLYPPPGMTAESLKEHVMLILRRGIGVEERP